MRRLLLVVVIAFPVWIVSEQAFSQTTLFSKESIQEIPEHRQVVMTGMIRTIDYTENTFTLNYGGNVVTVQTDSPFKRLYEPTATDRLVVGERVSVSGRVDENWMDQKIVDAYAITRANGEVLYSSVRDVVMPERLSTKEEGDYIVLSGEVASINGTEGFLLKYGDEGGILVATEGMAVNPLRENAFNPVEIGDSVTVRGVIDNDLFEMKQINAYAVLQNEYLN